MNWLKSLKIKTKLACNTGIIILLFALALGIFYQTLQTTQDGFSDVIEHELALATLAADTNILMLEARRSEKDFLLREDMKYPGQVEKTVTSLLDTTRKIEALATVAEQGEIFRQAGEISAQAGIYLASFQKIVAAYQINGLDPNSGLRGEFRDAAHAFSGKMPEHAVDNLIEALLQIRRYEKDYLRTKQEKYGQKLIAAMDTYQS
jgi:methyl-accepting chemotaxis protein